MNRRGFLGSILALAAAPAVVRADSLMRVVPRETTIVFPTPAGGWGKISRVVLYDADGRVIHSATLDQPIPEVEASRIEVREAVRLLDHPIAMKKYQRDMLDQLGRPMRFLKPGEERDFGVIAFDVRMNYP